MTGSIPPYAEQFIQKRVKKGEALGDVYNFDRESTSGQGGFETFRDPINRQHSFHFNDDTGKALLFSQGYTSPKGRDNGIKSVIKNAAVPERFASKEKNGKYYFILKAGNRQEIAQSRFFDSAEERDRWIALFVGSVAGYATAYGVTLAGDPATTMQTESFTLAAPPSPRKEEKNDAGAIAGAVAGAGALAASGDGGATDDVPEPPAPKRSTPPPVIEKAEKEEAYAYAGDHDDDGGGFRLWLPWIIGLLAVVLILFWLLSMLDGCGGAQTPLARAEDGDAQEEVVAAGPAEAAAEELEAESPPPAPTADSAGSTGEPPEPLGPAATALGFSDGSTEGQIANLLSKADRSLPASFILNEINFPRHSAKLNKSAYDQVDNLIRLMQAYPNIRVSFEGHIDPSEDENIARAFMAGENITLSAVRARCLYQKFVEAGISENRVDFTGRGAADPLVSNTTEQNKQRNRRLEVVISEQ